MKNILLPVAFILFSALFIPSFAQLNPGDIMIVGFMGDGDGTPFPTSTDPPSANCGDGFSFLCMVDIPTGEQVIFTEEEWTPTSFNSEDEGHVIWTNNTGSAILAGTVIQVTTHGQAEATDGSCGSLTSTAGTVIFGDDGSGTDSWELSSSNEEIYVYQGTPGSPTNWISAFFTDEFGVNSFVPTSSPDLSGFVVNLESIDSDADIAVYNGATDCADPAACLANITNPSNWSTDNGAGFQCCDEINADYPRDVPAEFEGLRCQPPVISCPADVEISCEASTDPAATGTPTVTEGCGAIVVTFADTETPGLCANEKVISREWTATDDDANSTSCTQTITVIDDNAPVAPTPPANVTVQCAADVPAPVDLTATDNCSADITVSPTSVVTPGACANDFTMVRTWTFTDDCGNTSSISQTITVLDDLAPVAPTAPADLVLACADDVPPPVGLTAVDNCGGDITVNPTAQIIPGSCINDFSMVRTWTFTDDCGNTSSISQTITVLDDLAPVAPTAPADLVLACADDVPPPVGLTAVDNCGGGITVNPTAQVIPGSCINDFSMVRTWTFTDDCGNTSSISQTITVLDDLAPVAPTAPADLVLACADDVPPPVGLTAVDNCGGGITVNPTAQIIPGSCINDFSMVRTWTFTDDCGNTSSISQTITVLDDLAPVAPTAPADLVLACADDVPPPVGLTAVDNCGGDITVNPTAQVIPGSCINEFSMVRTWTFTDDCGNTSSISQTITVLDDLAPVAPTAPADLVLACADDVPPPVGLTAVDNCGGDITVNPTAQIIPGSCINDFSMVRTWTFTDVCGNTSSVSQVIDVNDDTAPIISGIPAGSLNVDNDPGQCEAVVNYPDISATDNCDGAVDVSVFPASGSLFPLGSTTVSVTATDACGNTNTVFFDVNVNDTEAPELTCPSDLSVGMDPGLCGAVVNYSAPIGTDNCSGVVTDQTGGLGSGAFFPVGTTTETFTATDAAGNVTICSFDITVVDAESPVLTVATKPLVLWPPDHKYFTVNVLDFVLDVTDNCSALALTDIIITGVTSDEPEDATGNGDGNTRDDMVVGQDCQSVDLRAERQGSGNGRVYTISVAVMDESGNTGTADFQVHIPKSKKKAVLDDGTVYVVNGCGNGNARIADSNTFIEERLTVSDISTYPNPFQNKTTIEFVLPYDSETTIDIYTLNGIRLETLFHENVIANKTYKVVFEKEYYSDQMFIYKLNTDFGSHFGKLISR